jgi:hypothetical protein
MQGHVQWGRGAPQPSNRAFNADNGEEPEGEASPEAPPSAPGSLTPLYKMSVRRFQSSTYLMICLYVSDLGQAEEFLYRARGR